MESPSRTDAFLSFGPVPLVRDFQRSEALLLRVLLRRHELHVAAVTGGFFLPVIFLPEVASAAFEMQAAREVSSWPDRHVTEE